MKLRGTSTFFVGVLLACGLNLALYLLRDSTSPEIGWISLSFAVIAQVASLLWLGWLSMPRLKHDKINRPAAIALLLVGCYWAVWAFHYSGCHRIKLLGHGQCALPRTAQADAHPYLHFLRQRLTIRSSRPHVVASAGCTRYASTRPPPRHGSA